MMDRQDPRHKNLDAILSVSTTEFQATVQKLASQMPQQKSH